MGPADVQTDRWTDEQSDIQGATQLAWLKVPTVSEGGSAQPNMGSAGVLASVRPTAEHLPLKKKNRFVSTPFCLPVYGDIFYEVCSLRVCDDDAFGWDCQRYLPKLLSAGSGLWMWNRKTHMCMWKKIKSDWESGSGYMQGRMIALLIKTQRALKCDSCCRAELSTLHELSQKCGEFIKGDRTGGGAAMWSPEWVLEVGPAASDSPCRSAPSGVSEKLRPKCWACGLRECLLTMTMTSLPSN